MLYRKMMRLLANMRFRTYILASMRLSLALVGIGIVGLFLVIGDWPPTLATLWKVPTSLVEAFGSTS